MSSSYRRRATVIAGALAALSIVGAPVAHAEAPPANPLLSEQDTWGGALPLAGSGIFDRPVVEGGWSAFAPIDNTHYWTISDRGPNGLPNVTVGGAATRTARTFLSPSFTPTIYKVAIGRYGQMGVQARIPLHLKAGAVDPARAYMAAHPDASKGIDGGAPNQITGLPQIVAPAQGAALPADAGAYKQSAARDEVPYAADGVTTLPSDPYGLDTEGIAVDPRDGSFWLGDEYRPSLIHVAPDGTLLNRIVPQGADHIAADTTDAAKFAASDESVLPTAGLLPRAFAFRKQNRGMEGATLSPDGKTLFGMLQSSIEPPAGKGDSRTLRLVRFDVSDPVHPQLTGEFIYRLDTPSATSGVKQTDISNSDIYALDATHLLVDEHDNVTDVAGSGQKRIYAIDLAGATNIAGDAAANGADPQVEAQNAVGIVPVAKKQILDLGQFGYNHDKPEGIGVFPNGNLAVQDDNDFGFNQANEPQNAGPSDPPFLVTPSTKTTQLWQFSGLGLLPQKGDDDHHGDGPGGGHPGNGDNPGGGHGAPTTGQGGGTKPGKGPKITFTTRIVSKGKVLKVKAIKLSIKVSASGTAKSSVTFKANGKTVVLGSSTQKLKAGKGTLSVPLSATGRKHLTKTSKSVVVALSIKTTGAAGTSTTKVHLKLK